MTPHVVTNLPSPYLHDSHKPFILVTNLHALQTLTFNSAVHYLQGLRNKDDFERRQNLKRLLLDAESSPSYEQKSGELYQ